MLQPAKLLRVCSVCPAPELCRFGVRWYPAGRLQECTGHNRSACAASAAGSQRQGWRRRGHEEGRQGRLWWRQPAPRSQGACRTSAAAVDLLQYICGCVMTDRLDQHWTSCLTPAPGVMNTGWLPGGGMVCRLSASLRVGGRCIDRTTP